MFKLFPFQKEGSAFLQSRRYALLADEMGLGKTPQAIDACKNLNKVLVITPSVAKYNWQSEFLKFDHRMSWVAGDGFLYNDEDVLITSFNYATAYLEQYKKYHWDAIIIDEAHGLKEPTAERTKAILGTHGLLHNTDRLWALSGTLAPNNAAELWIWMYNFGYTTLSYQGFVSRYCNAYTVGGSKYSRTQIAGSNTKFTPELRVILKRFSLRRLKREVLDLPPIFHNVYYIKGDTDDVLNSRPDLKEKLQLEYQTLCEKLDVRMGMPDDKKLLNVLGLLSQSVSALRRYHGLKKVRPIAEIIKTELRAGEYKKIVIFGIHTDVLETLFRLFLLDGFNTILVTGKIPSKKRFEAQNLFQDNDDIPIFIGNIEAGGTNLTLTAASQVAFIEQDWVPGNNAQAADRTHRIGQTEAVNVRHFAIRGSIDEKITATLTRKIQEISTFIDS